MRKRIVGARLNKCSVLLNFAINERSVTPVLYMLPAHNLAMLCLTSKKWMGLLRSKWHSICMQRFLWTKTAAPILPPRYLWSLVSQKEENEGVLVQFVAVMNALVQTWSGVLHQRIEATGAESFQGRWQRLRSLPCRLPVDVTVFYLLGASISLMDWELGTERKRYDWRVGLSWPPLQHAHDSNDKPVEENFRVFDNYIDGDQTVEKHKKILTREIQKYRLHNDVTYLNESMTTFSRLKGSYLVAKFLFDDLGPENYESYELLLDVHGDADKAVAAKHSQQCNTATLIGFAAEDNQLQTRDISTFDVPLRCRHSFTALLELMLSLVESRPGDTWQEAWESRLPGSKFLQACGLELN